MTLIDAENAMRVEAQTWAQANAVEFAWDNGPPKDPHTAPTIEWQFRQAEPERITGATLKRNGVARGRIYVPAGSGALAALQLAESLQDLFRGRAYVGAEILDEVHIDQVGRDGPSYVVEISIPWEFDERRIPQGAVGLQETPGAVIAYQAFRQRWESLVRAPLSLRTFFDNSPPEAEPAPWALAKFRTLEPVPVEMQVIRVPGRVIVALNFPLGAGLQACETAATTIEHAFDQVTFRGICFGTPVVTRVGRTPADTWQTNVRLPFHYDVRT